jgi:uncharacterized membrane protein
MQPMTSLLIGCALFVGTHFLLSHPLRAPLAVRLGERGFQMLYSVVALGTFVLMVQAYRAAPPAAPLWTAGDGLWVLATLIMLAASILLVGSFIGNPALAAPGAREAAAAPARGVLAITRHPMMWSFALWGVVHIMVVPTPAQMVFASAMIILALAGSWWQDAKKARLMGASWQDWQARTAFVPFAGQIAGRLRWAEALPSAGVLIGGIALWLIASWAHGALGYSPAGIWFWH